MRTATYLLATSQRWGKVLHYLDYAERASGVATREAPERTGGVSEGICQKSS